MQPISVQNSEMLRLLAEDSSIISIQPYKAAANGHLFQEGDEAILHGLENFSEFNGQKVKISAIRKNEDFGRTYYIEGAINKFVNWVYEYRLKPVK